MVGEFLDSLKAFGLSDAHPVMRPGIDYLLSRQNPDGSWGDLDGEDIFARFHATWTAIDGLRDYAWRGERLSYPKLLPLLREWAKPR
jgi:squalene cyclase